MEPAKIDWQNLDSFFVLDHNYENINAPQWFDFLSSSSPSSNSTPDDVAWFCRSDCNHPRTAEDFLKSSPSSKLLRSVNVSKLISDWTRREATNLKRRGGVATTDEETENQNPNFSTPPPNHNQSKYLNKAGIKSSAEKRSQNDEYSEVKLESDDKPKLLKPTHSAKDLFGGREIFGRITEFCSELKKMAVARKEDEVETQKLCPNKALRENEKEKEKDQKRVVLGPLSEKPSEGGGKERKPLVQVKGDGGECRSNGKGRIKRNKLRSEESENIPVSLDLNNVQRDDKMKMSSIRTNPPTPQGFSATRDPFKGAPSKALKSRLMEKEVSEEQEQIKTLREELSEKNDNETASLVAAKEGRTLDVFWFLKPCTLSS